MFKYLLGLLKNLFNPAVSIFAFIDNLSFVDRNAKVYRKAKIFKSSIGAFSYIGSGTSIVCVKVGKFCSIAGNSSIGMGTHSINNLSTSPIFTEKINGTGSTWVNQSCLNPFEKINVGNDVWIGTRVMVMGGVNIGDGAVIGAGAIVTKDVPPYAIVAGVPARIIKYRFEKQIIDKLLNLKWWNFPEDELKQKIHCFQTNEITTELLDELNKK